MTLTLFTPCNNSSRLQRLYDSIAPQEFDEWIILYNNGVKKLDFNDSRIKYFDVGNVPPYVGLLKGMACDHATSDILFEMDQDDILMDNAIAKVKEAFEIDPSIGFVYSNTIHCDDNYKKIQRFSEIYGWKYREVIYKGHILDEHRSFPPNPSSISRIWFAPNHLRAFRRDVYESIGGYNRSMRILDDLDLMCRLYSATNFYHIDEGLYVYVVHGDNTWLKPDINQEIQSNVFRIHDQYIFSLAERWADLHGLKKIDLGGRIDAPKGYTTVDLRDADITADLSKKWPFEDGSVGVVRAYDVIEHLPDPLFTMKELHRVLAPGGYALIQVPSTDGRGAFQDPTHKSFWNENSFLYYTDKKYNRYIDCPVRFQAMRLYTTDKNNVGVCWTIAHLLKLNDKTRTPGEISI